MYLVQARDETGAPFQRSDDKFSAYFIHNVEDIVEFLDLEDAKLKGEYKGICRSGDCCGNSSDWIGAALRKHVVAASANVVFL
jgi:hypothetical protein